jgi:RNA polymerase sigma-70 factor (ECF subfamily)
MELSEPNDSQLIRSLQAGDERAFEALLERHQRAVLNFCYRLLGNAADADDAAQETFVRLYQHRAKFDPDRPLPAWLFTVARRLCIDRQRYRRRHPTQPLATAPEPVCHTNAVLTQELEAQIAAAVAALPEEQRVAVVLAEYHGLPQTEIAGIMGCSVKSVETRLYRARQELRRRLAAWL